VDYCNKMFCLEVKGDFACFTRPEMKVERVSYDVITPSAARGVFEAIFWKPAIKWRVRKIEVLNPIQWTSVRRNEVGAITSDRSDGIFIEDVRQQRAGLFLRDVAYRLYAELDFIPVRDRQKSINPVPEYLRDEAEVALLKEPAGIEKNSDTENPGKYNAMFERRARKGQCFNQPYLGTREFSCAFRLLDKPELERKPIDETRDLGFMLYDMVFPTARSIVQDIQPAFFRAKIDHGIINIPAWESDEVRR